MRISRLSYLLILFLIVLFGNVCGQTYYFDKYSVNEGLSSSKVYTIIQDRNDYLWLGTESGLSRFGGADIENFSVNNGIAQGGVRSIMEDHTGRIWFGHLDGGLSIFDGTEFKVVSYDTVVISSDITSIREHSGRIWLTTSYDGAVSAVVDEGLAHLTDIRQYKGREGLSDQVSNSYIDSEGALYCLAEVGIKKYIPDDDRFENYRPEGLTSFFSTIVMFEDSRGERWFGTYNGGLYRLNPSSGELKVYDIRDGLAKNWVTRITEDSRGRVWVGTWGGGITVFDGDKLKNFDNTNGLDAMFIQCLLEDHEGNMLITSQYNGLNIFKGDHFVNYISERMFPDMNVWAVNEDRYGRLWFGTNAGITLYDPENRISWLFDEENHSIGKKIRFIRNDRNGKIWIGTSGNGIYRYDFEKNNFTYDRGLSDILHFDLVVTAMTVDIENNLWVGTNEGVAFWDIEDEQGARYTRINGLSGMGITSLYAAEDGRVWIGTDREKGLTCYEPDRDTFRIVDIGLELSPTSIVESADGTLWLGTSYGLLGLRNNSVVLHLTEKDGLLSNNINLIQPDNNGSVYIGTNFGLNRYNTIDSTITTYTRRNGFIGIETRGNASAIDVKGNLWFGTTNGVTCLKPMEMPGPDLNPLTHIKGIMVNLLPRPMVQGMRLNYKEMSIVFDYYSVCLTNPEAVKYQVMLEGADPDWRPESDQTRVIYSALSPGRYTFLVRAQNSDGVWNREPVSYSFAIRPPFYFNPWFIAVVVIVLGFLVVVYIKIRERNLIIEKKILEEKVEERTAEVVQKSLEIEEKNRDITASIRYAERIQMAMLPPESSFNDTFILFMPKDIVSGDFYWMYDDGERQFLSAVDCTGHGVPGAFMSIIGFNSLTKIVREYGLIRPSAILDQLNVEVTRSLLQRGEEVINDGMDLALMAFDRKKRRIEFAGAYNPLVIIRDGEIITVKADRFPIGMAVTRNKKFSNNEMDVKKGDMLYMFSDGFADQFGGPDGRKYKSINLKNELARIYQWPIFEQKEHLLNTIKDWMGDLGQVDDILVIGTRVP